MSRTKKKFLIIFFSVLSALILESVIIFLIMSLLSNKDNKSIENQLSFITKDNHFIYKSSSQSILYGDKEYWLGDYIDEEGTTIEYIGDEYIIYSYYKSRKYFYYSIDPDGKSNYLLKMDAHARWNFYQNNMFYLEKNNEFYTYDMNQNILNSVTYDEYLLGNNNKYQVVLYDKKRLKITDSENGLYKYFILDDFKEENEVINNLSKIKNQMVIYDYLVVGENVYITIYFDSTYAFIIDFNFKEETISFVDKIINKYWSDNFKMYYLQNQICYPLDALIAKS